MATAHITLFGCITLCEGCHVRLRVDGLHPECTQSKSKAHPQVVLALEVCCSFMLALTTQRMAMQGLCNKHRPFFSIEHDFRSITGTLTKCSRILANPPQQGQRHHGFKPSPESTSCIPNQHKVFMKGA